MQPTRLASLAAAATVSGLLLTTLFAPFGFWPLGWIGLVPLLWAIHEARTAVGAALLGLLAGLVHRLTSMFWIIHVVEEYGYMPAPAAWASLLILATYLALYPATLAFLLRGPLRRLGPTAFFLLPPMWVAAELAQAFLLTGLPWNLLGYSQLGFLPALQVADLAGVYGISFVLVTANAALAFALLQRPLRSSGFALPLAGAGAVLLAALGYGFVKVAEFDGPVAGADTFDVAVVQDELTNAQRRAAHRDGERLNELFAHYTNSTRAAAAAGAEMVIWGEGSLLFLDMNPPNRFAEQYILSLARDESIWLLLGSNDYFDVRDKLYNAAFTIAPDNAGNAAAGQYNKTHLTPFGEYVPYKWLFGWVPQIVPEISDFETGEEFTTLPLRGGRLGVAICFEIIFPDLVRRFSAEGANMLATISNDAWFGRSAANAQHFEMAMVRAVENRRYLARCAATGVSGIVGPGGRALPMRTLDGRTIERTPIYERVVAVGTVQLLGGRTVYATVGDLFAWMCALFAVLSLAVLRYTFRPVGAGRHAAERG